MLITPGCQHLKDLPVNQSFPALIERNIIAIVLINRSKNIKR